MPELSSHELPVDKLSEDAQNVCVAVHIRPLVVSELEQGAQSCLVVTPGLPQIGINQHNFTYDHVFGGEYGSTPAQLYPKCVAPLVEGLFKGYNATVFAYGQTGSGKTYTMGSEYRPGSRATSGVIPEAINALFNKISQAKDWHCSLRVSFVEIHKEEVRDLLVSHHGPRPTVSIREVMGGGVCLFGAVEKEVRSQDEMAELLEMGTLCRATASTNMNNRSSRSHAIFTITLEQRRQDGDASTSPARARGADDDDDDNDAADGGDGEDSYLCAKMHLVDLAGSERQKKTGAEGQRLKEGIHINRGLLALGNVINAIVDNHKHVPYRDSKLTRLLQDSLGGNSRTVMIACVSPADINFEESLNTLRYADRARHIRNKPTVNRDPVAAQVAFFRQQLAVLRSENRALKAALAAEGKSLGTGDDVDGSTGPAGGQHWAVVETLQQENTTLELDNTRLKIQLEEVTRELEAVKQKSYLVQASLDRMTAELQLLRGTGDTTTAAGSAPVSTSGGGGGATNAHDMVVAQYVARVADLEKELKAARQLHSLRRRHPQSRAAAAGSGGTGGGADDSHGGVPRTPGASAGMSAGGAGMMTPLGGVMGVPFTPEEGLGMGGEGMGGVGVEGESLGALVEGHEEEEAGDDIADEEMYYAEMAAHALEQEKMKHELAALQRLLESKEKKMSELQSGSGQVPALKHHYDRVLADLQKERDGLMQEKVAIMQKLQHLQVANEEERKRLEAAYKEKLAAADEKLKALRHKEREFVSMQKLKQRTEDMCRRLSTDINRIKQQKVALQKMMETSAKQFAQWRQEREKELAQLRKQARRSAAQIQALEAMQAKQYAVLQRKIADANAARKKLRELQTAPGLDRSHHGGGLRDSISSRPGALASSNASLETRLRESDGVQPNSSAPMLRNEQQRQDWIESQLSLCCTSHEYQRVLDGEMAQRASVTDQLRNLHKRLLMCNKLEPASPLVSLGPNGCPTPCGPNQVGDVVVAQLLERKAQLERQLEEHNMQISELHTAWANAKTEEESRSGGPSDPKRWNMVRNIVECRELLKTTFKLACRYKSSYHDFAADVRCKEDDLNLLRTQLDAARKEAEAQRKRAAAIEATAASAIATPYLPSSSFVQRVDDTDMEVDDLLHQLHLAKTPSSILPSQQGDGAAAKSGGPVQFASVEDEGPQLGSPDGSVEVSVEPAVSVGAGGVRSVGTQELKTGTTVGAANRRTADLEPPVNCTDRQLQYDDHTSSDADLGEDDQDADHDDEDEDDDQEWDPSHATPRAWHTGSRRQSSRPATRASTSSAGIADVSGPAAAAGRRRSRGLSGNGAAEVEVTGRLAGAGGWATAEPKPGVVMERLRQPDSQEYIQNQRDYGGPSKEEAAWVHADINRKRALKGLPEEKKLTIPLLTENLRGRYMLDGKQWAASKKTKSRMISDYLLLEERAGRGPAITDTAVDATVNNSVRSSTEPSLGSSWPSLSGPPARTHHTTAPMAIPSEPEADHAFNMAVTTGRAKSASHDGLHLHLPRERDDHDEMMGLGHRASFMAGASPGSPGASLDYRAAVKSPGAAMLLRPQLSHEMPLGCGGSPRAMGTSQARMGNVGHSVPSLPMNYINGSTGAHVSSSNGTSSMRASLAAIGMTHLAPQASPSPRMSSAESPLQAGNVTPMSMLYIQKAKEARARMNDIKQFIPRSATGVGASSPSPLSSSMAAAAAAAGLTTSNGSSGTAAAAALARQLSGRSPRVMDRQGSPASSQSTPRRDGRVSPSQRAPSSGRGRSGIWK